MTKVYVVCGGCSNYSSDEDWVVAAYSYRADADKLVADIEQWMREAGVAMGGQDVESYRRYVPWQRTGDVVKCPFDPKFRCTEYGADYWVEEVELR